VTTETIYRAFDRAAWELQHAESDRLRDKFARQFDTFWFELRSRMRMFDAMRAPMPSSTRVRDGLPDPRIVSARYPGATITTTGDAQTVVWVYQSGGK
jgi:hypothetical protein